MNKIPFLLSFILSIGFAQAQITTSEVKVEQTGNSTSIMGPVGIGTTSTGSGMLTVNGTSGLSLLRLENDGLGNEASLRLRSKSSSGAILHGDISLFATGAAQGYLGFKVPYNNTVNAGYDLIINDKGNVGIGTTTPFSSMNNLGLHINHGGHTSLMIGDGSSNGGIIQSSDNSQRLFLGSNLYDDTNSSWQNFSAGSSAAVDILGSYGKIRFITTSTASGYQSSNIRMSIRSDGNVGIGIDNPEYKLEVNGTVRATTFSAVTPPWSDFVFEDNYKLKNLDEVETFIKNNKHLPDIPSEKELQENGLDLPSMDSKLLQKIEELTLYLIEQNKEIRELRELTQQQQVDIERLKIK